MGEGFGPEGHLSAPPRYQEASPENASTGITSSSMSAPSTPRSGHRLSSPRAAGITRRSSYSTAYGSPFAPQHDGVRATVPASSGSDSGSNSDVSARSARRTQPDFDSRRTSISRTPPAEDMRQQHIVGAGPDATAQQALPLAHHGRALSLIQEGGSSFESGAESAKSPTAAAASAVKDVDAEQSPRGRLEGAEGSHRTVRGMASSASPPHRIAEARRQERPQQQSPPQAAVEKLQLGQPGEQLPVRRQQRARGDATYDGSSWSDGWPYLKYRDGDRGTSSGTRASGEKAPSSRVPDNGLITRVKPSEQQQAEGAVQHLRQQDDRGCDDGQQQQSQGMDYPHMVGQQGARAPQQLQQQRQMLSGDEMKQQMKSIVMPSRDATAATVNTPSDSQTDRLPDRQRQRQESSRSLQPSMSDDGISNLYPTMSIPDDHVPRVPLGTFGAGLVPLPASAAGRTLPESPWRNASRHRPPPEKPSPQRSTSQRRTAQQDPAASPRHSNPIENPIVQCSRHEPQPVCGAQHSVDSSSCPRLDIPPGQAQYGSSTAPRNPDHNVATPEISPPQRPHSSPVAQPMSSPFEALADRQFTAESMPSFRVAATDSRASWLAGKSDVSDIFGQETSSEINYVGSLKDKLGGVQPPQQGQQAGGHTQQQQGQREERQRWQQQLPKPQIEPPQPNPPHWQDPLQVQQYLQMQEQQLQHGRGQQQQPTPISLGANQQPEYQKAEGHPQQQKWQGQQQPHHGELEAPSLPACSGQGQQQVRGQHQQALPVYESAARSPQELHHQPLPPTQQQARGQQQQVPPLQWQQPPQVQLPQSSLQQQARDQPQELPQQQQQQRQQYQASGPQPQELPQQQWQQQQQARDQQHHHHQPPFASPYGSSIHHQVSNHSEVSSDFAAATRGPAGGRADMFGFSGLGSSAFPAPAFPQTSHMMSSGPGFSKFGSLGRGMGSDFGSSGFSRRGFGRPECDRPGPSSGFDRGEFNWPEGDKAEFGGSSLDRGRFGRPDFGSHSGGHTIPGGRVDSGSSQTVSQPPEGGPMFRDSSRAGQTRNPYGNQGGPGSSPVHTPNCGSNMASGGGVNPPWTDDGGVTPSTPSPRAPQAYTVQSPISPARHLAFGPGADVSTDAAYSSGGYNGGPGIAYTSTMVTTAPQGSGPGYRTTIVERTSGPAGSGAKNFYERKVTTSSSNTTETVTNMEG